MANGKFLDALPQGTGIIGPRRNYTVDSVLGQGGFGITYSGTNDAGLRVAVKEFFPGFCAVRQNDLTVSPKPGREEEYSARLASFATEGSTLAALNDLEHIVHVLDIFPANNTSYLVMEFVEGEPLFRRAEARGGRLLPEDLLPRVQPLLADMNSMHARGVLHRDITPDNIMWQPDDSLKLIDFGAARSMNSEHMTVMYKRGFAPPEQYMLSGQGTFTDVYALCATLYYLLTGRTIPDAIARLEDETLPSPTELGVGLTPEEDRAIMKGLAVQRENRTQSMRELECGLYGIVITGMGQSK